jgi:hypothetical protein
MYLLCPFIDVVTTLLTKSVSGKFNIEKPENDSLKYYVTRLPLKGDVSLDKKGYWKYTPYEDGADSFEIFIVDGCKAICTYSIYVFIHDEIS